jgi:hypothetical protein
MAIELDVVTVTGLREEHVRDARTLVFEVRYTMPTYTGQSDVERLEDSVRLLACATGRLPRMPAERMRVRLLDARGEDLL